MFVVDGSPVCLFRVNDKVFALDDRCPHAGASLARGYVEGEVVRCRIHHWGFRIQDGVYVDEDNPRCNAISIPVKVVDGQVAIALHKS
jgi:nitrite reductase/ring-hydroxylating ferredoxin subunit